MSHLRFLLLIKALDRSVLCRLAWLNKSQLYSVFESLLNQHTTALSLRISCSGTCRMKLAIAYGLDGVFADAYHHSKVFHKPWLRTTGYLLWDESDEPSKLLNKPASAWEHSEHKARVVLR